MLNVFVGQYICKLADFPLIGAPLSSIYEIDSDYRFLVCGNYLAFYRPQESEVLIDRILYGRRDYLVILFGDFPKNETEYANDCSTCAISKDCNFNLRIARCVACRPVKCQVRHTRT